MHDIALHDGFVPQGCERAIQPQPAVTLGAGTIWMQAYQAVNEWTEDHVLLPDTVFGYSYLEAGRET